MFSAVTSITNVIDSAEYFYKPKEFPRTASACPHFFSCLDLNDNYSSVATSSILWVQWYLLHSWYVMWCCNGVCALMGQIPSISEQTVSVSWSGVETERFAGACNTRLAEVHQFAGHYHHCTVMTDHKILIDQFDQLMALSASLFLLQKFVLL